MNIYCIIVLHNGSKWIDKCFGSLVNSSIPLKILAIDNASTDATPNIIREKFPQVEVIETGKNLGFGKANNIGLKRVLDENCDYAFLLNQDAWVEPDTIENLINIYNSNPEFGILAPLQLNGEGSLIDALFQQYSVAPCRELFTDLLIKKNSRHSIYETNFVNAACWLLSRKTIEVIGGFDPLFPHYSEDNDYINRVIFQRLKIGLCPNIIVFHDREYRPSEQNYDNLLNYVYVRLLVNLKNNLIAQQSKLQYFKKNFFNLISAYLGNNKRHYKLQYQATRLIIKNYRKIIAHRLNETNKAPHYLQ